MYVRISLFNCLRVFQLCVEKFFSCMCVRFLVQYVNVFGFMVILSL